MWIEFNPPINFYFPIKRRILWEKFFFSINFLFETENGVKLRSRYLFFLVVIRLMAFMFVVMDSEGDFFSRRQSTSLTCIPWTAWSCKNYEQGDRKLSLFLENYFSFFVHLALDVYSMFWWFQRFDFFGVDGWVGYGMLVCAMWRMVYHSLSSCIRSYMYKRHSIVPASLKIYDLKFNHKW